jgi:hypothetical protein
LKKSLTICALLLSSFTANASIISYAGYTHDTDTDIVVGGGLEWLQWDLTVGQSIETALINYASDGWGLASNIQTSALFNAFDFGSTFDSDESTTQGFNTGTDLGTEDSANHAFITMFGDTYNPLGSITDYGEGGYDYSGAYFGTDLNANGLYNTAFIWDDYTQPNGMVHPGRAVLRADEFGAGSNWSNYGVALVRPATVPEPAPLVLLLTGLVGVIVARKRKTTAVNYCLNL